MFIRQEQLTLVNTFINLHKIIVSQSRNCLLLILGLGYSRAFIPNLISKYCQKYRDMVEWGGAFLPLLMMSLWFGLLVLLTKGASSTLISLISHFSLKMLDHFII